MELLKTIVKDIEDIEKKLLKYPQESTSVEHIFAPGLYTRKVLMKAGNFVVGHHQNHEQLNVFIKGKVKILNDDGSSTILKAPMTFVGKPGRKIGYILEDVTWLNVYATEETDVEKLEAKFLTKSEAWLIENKNRNHLKLLKNSVDSEDYKSFIAELGLTEEDVRATSDNEEDMRPLPTGRYKCKVGVSGIEGKGLFATSDIEDGEMIAPSRIKGERTIAGRYPNHSLTPNAMMIGTKKGDIVLFAASKIKGCHGGNDGDEITTNYRENYKVNMNSKGRICQE